MPTITNLLGLLRPTGWDDRWDVADRQANIDALENYLGKGGVHFDVGAYGAEGDGATDDTAAIQAALDAAAPVSGRVVLTPGKAYGISSTLNLPAGVTLAGGNSAPRGYLPAETHAKLRALAGFPAGSPMIDASSRRNPVVDAVWLDGRSIAEVGVYVSDSIQAHVRNCAFKSFVTGGAGVRGGGALYLYIDDNYFGVGDYYGIDLLEAYEISSHHYYGVNVGTFSGNSVNVGRGIRLTGIMSIISNDFEGGGQNGNACIDVDGSSQSNLLLLHNYFELSGGTFGSEGIPRAIKLREAAATIHGNQIFGDVNNMASGSIAIDAASNFGALSILSNGLYRWATGIRTSGSGQAPTMVAANGFNTVTTQSDYGGVDVVTSTAAVESNSKIPERLLQGDGGWTMTGGLRFQLVGHNGVTKLNLRHSSFLHYYFAGMSATTVTALENAEAGRLFWVSAVADKMLTIEHGAVFVLASGQNYTLAANEPIPFFVGNDGKAYEIGQRSLVDTPEAAATDLKDVLVAKGLLTDGGATPVNLDGGKATVGDLEADGALDHDGTTAGFFGVAPVARPAATDEIKAALAALGLLTDGGASPLNLDGGDLTAGAANLSGDLNHDGSNVGFFGVAPTPRPAAYTPTNVTADRSYDANATTINELADVLGTLIADLQSLGLIG